ncbi:sugar transporter (hexose transporter) [Penicillium canariense]|uniref:Sugar transporter (Hexose transporter) n=1 Tax=Penicillium canariense TaxID=189055 RepID=A0A9W9LD58_9EURO|nr:sugar transporter (hexose transporter) [Penicillium canariense]KAJ5151416.1 sugar transporter (hexose transporter) [Penicillium canariense]
MANLDETQSEAHGVAVDYTVPHISVWKAPYLWKASFCVVGLCLFSSANGYDGSLLNGLQSLDTWQVFMEHPTGAWLGFINAIYWIGTFFGALVAAWTSNKFGRKVGIYFGISLLVVGSALQAAAPHDSAFIVARLIVGMSSGFLNNAAPLLLNEISYPTHRPVANALFMCGYYLGALIAAWVTFGTRVMDSSWSWRIPSITQVLCPVLALPALLMVPESPRWLVSMNRVPEARAALANLHASGDLNSPVVNHQVIDIQHTLELEEENAKTSGYAEMISTPGNRHRLFITISVGFYAQWVGNVVVSYYLALVLKNIGITKTRDQLLISGCLQIWNLIFATVGASLVEKVGRRVLFLLSGAIMLVSYITIAGLSGGFYTTKVQSIGTAVVPFLFIYFAGYDIALTPLLTAYPCEVWPYRLRSKGLSVAWISVVFGNMFNTFVNPIALDAIGWKYYFVFVAVLIAYEITVYLYYPETKGHTLEDMAVIFDKDDAMTSHVGEESEEKTGSTELVERV